ncbi:MAG: transcription antitermination factor NusB [Flammeovirgaceae bacterium]|jgi:transcription antitermination protein NusB|nr:transcription antitermination factor NusB [Flammeovirgaceae bacterium]
MLNRRVLRVKAMQALYSYFLMKASLRELVEEELLLKYALDPAIHDFGDRDIFEAKQLTIKNSFGAFFTEGHHGTSPDLTEEDVRAIKNSILSYEYLINLELAKIQKNMLAEREQILHLYLKILLLPAEFAFVDKQDREKIKSSFLKKNGYGGLSENVIIDRIKTHPELNRLVKSNEISWQSDIDQIRQWHRDVLKKDPYFIENQSLETPTAAQHLDLVKYIFKKVIFKNEVLEAYFDKNDLRWNENKPIIKSMVLKTIKIFEDGAEESLTLQSLSHNEDEDFDYLKKLFSQTVEKEYELEQIIGKKANNWDVSRMAVTDMIILKMALTEMMIFPSIPVKVTINEFIEISKNYSTPKSKQFVNGILDVLANELSSKGIIKKSGRGLIDNK